MDALTDALKLIVARSPRAAEGAIRALAAARANSPVLQHRYQQVLIMALADPEAEFTADERAQLAAGIANDGADAPRSTAMNIRLSAAERASLEEAAHSAGLSLSDYVRNKLFESQR